MPSPSSDLLKHKERVLRAIVDRTTKGRALTEFFLLAVLGVAIYGALMSLFAPAWWRVWAFSWRTVVLLFGSVGLALPSLVVFSWLRGSRVTLREMLWFTLAALATVGLVLVSLAPVTGFFTWTGRDAGATWIMHLLAGFLALVFGLLTLGRGLSVIHDLRKADDANSRPANEILGAWVILLIVVLVQMISVLKFPLP